MGNILGGSRRRRQSQERRRQQQQKIPKPAIDPWSPFRIKGYVSRREIASHVKGSEEPSEKRDTECMICYLFFNTSELNATKCCKHLVCTDCFIQIKPEGYAQKIPCPYCTRDNFGVEVFHATSPKSKNISPLKGYDKEEERLVKNMKNILENVASSPSESFAVIENYEKCQKEMMKEAEERSHKIKTSVIPHQQPSRADEIRDNIVRLLMSGPSSQQGRSNNSGGSALSRMFGHTPQRRVTDADLARTEELLLLRALQMSLEESRQKDQREQEDLEAAIAASSPVPKPSPAPQSSNVSSSSHKSSHDDDASSKGRCESGVDADIDNVMSSSTNSTTVDKDASVVVALTTKSSSSNQTIPTAAPSSSAVDK